MNTLFELAEYVKKKNDIVTFNTFTAMRNKVSDPTIMGWACEGNRASPR